VLNTSFDAAPALIMNGVLVALVTPADAAVSV
jgi:hypothetical protein